MMFRLISTALPALLLAATGAFAAEPQAQQTPPAAPASKSSTDALPAVDTSAPQPAEAPPVPDASSSPRAAQPDSKPSAPGRRVQADRLDLDTTIVTGNRELPKVLYIVPWKKADLGDLPAQPFNTLLDEVLAPVDRDVFRREVTYYGVVSAGGNASPAAPAAPTSAPARGDEK
jgi:hypothetical protein